MRHTSLPSSLFLFPALAGVTLGVSLACGGGSSSSRTEGGTLGAIDPASTVAGQFVNLSGKGFTRDTRVQFGNAQPAVEFQGATLLRVQVPPGSGSVTVRLVGDPGPGQAFTYSVIPAVTALSQSSLRADAELVLTGSGFTGATRVAFGEKAATRFIPASDRSLRVTVPAGTGTVAVTVTTPAGTSPAGPAFTFLNEPGKVSSFTPTSGGPGTRVVLTGSQFVASDRVLFGNVPAVTRISPDATQLIAWVPADPALRQGAPPTLNVAFHGAGTLNGDPFTVLAPRLTIQGGTFAEVPAKGLNPDFTGRLFDYPAVQRTGQYGLWFPKAPFLHPYDPDANRRKDPATGDEMIAPRTTFSIRFPAAFRETLPAAILQKLGASGISLDKVDIFCYSQNYFWDVTQPYELRPQSWTDPDAPLVGTYSETTSVKAGLFEAESGVVLDPADFSETIVSTHDLGATPGPGFTPFTVVSSPDNLKLSGLAVANTTSFWSLVVAGQEAVATLHLLFNDADQANLEKVMDQPAPITIGALAAGLSQAGLGSPRPIQQTVELFRPVITGALLDTPASGDPTLTIIGSGFKGSGATTVTVGTGNQPLTPVTVVDDSTLTATLPAALAGQGNIIVTTDAGASAPAPLGW